jgi:hypothetical protein
VLAVFQLKRTRLGKAPTMVGFFYAPRAKPDFLSRFEGSNESRFFVSPRFFPAVSMTLLGEI